MHPATFTILSGGWHDAAFVPMREGVEIATLVAGEPAVALLRYAPGASVPRHRHTGMETILVLEGSQSDDSGRYGTGALVINPEGSIHRVWSEDGCVVLIQWTRPVEMLENE
ncbi:cupin domain-containing protein [Acuticoccus mangrovi]|uniref:Cupin domain-containing protein n=1 Tax=Acuticoccus mangrovi TaxID=2796142 RepID=A0A934IMS9_9HYPH|nr:cupin domain-containing protein [Acuticoccus mangrovi]MBJ3775490.1 cupin domain-containing protein [Acuticoccus mangrovi]